MPVSETSMLPSVTRSLMASMTFLSVDAFWSVASNMVLFACARSKPVSAVRAARGGGVCVAARGLAARRRVAGGDGASRARARRRCSAFPDWGAPPNRGRGAARGARFRARAASWCRELVTAG